MHACDELGSHTQRGHEMLHSMIFAYMNEILNALMRAYDYVNRTCENDSIRIRSGNGF